MGGLKGISELEAMLAFKEKELEELRQTYEADMAKQKKQKAMLKEELEVLKE